MSQELKSGSVIISPEDAQYFKELKEFKKLADQNRFVIQDPSLFESKRSVYWSLQGMVRQKIEYSECNPEKIIQKLQKSNGELTEMIDKLINRSLWDRITNKY